MVCWVYTLESPRTQQTLSWWNLNTSFSWWTLQLFFFTFSQKKERKKYVLLRQKHLCYHSYAKYSQKSFGQVELTKQCRPTVSDQTVWLQDPGQTSPMGADWLGSTLFAILSAFLDTRKDSQTVTLWELYAKSNIGRYNSTKQNVKKDSLLPYVILFF